MKTVSTKYRHVNPVFIGSPSPKMSAGIVAIGRRKFMDETEKALTFLIKNAKTLTTLKEIQKAIKTDVEHGGYSYTKNQPLMDRLRKQWLTRQTALRKKK